MESPATFNFSQLLVWVEKQTGAVINFEDVSGISRDVPQLHLAQDQYFHHSPYCEFVKINGRQGHCHKAKFRSVYRARTGKPFASVCEMGLWDWVQPVVFHGELLGVLFLGSLRTRRPLRTVQGHAYEGPPIPELTPDRRRSLRQWGQNLRDTLVLIVENWMGADRSLPKQKPLAFYRDMTQLYIRNHYHEPVRLEDLARQLNLHPFYLGTLIRRACGRNFRSLLLEHRLNKAKILLWAAEPTVKDAAYAAGFSDSNYFSTVFRRATGMTPRRYIALKNQPGVTPAVRSSPAASP